MKGHIKIEFAHGDRAEIWKRSRVILKEMGVENWNISRRLSRYHVNRHTLPCGTPIGMVVRQVTRNFLKQKAEKAKKIAELAA